MCKLTYIKILKELYISIQFDFNKEKYLAKRSNSCGNELVNMFTVGWRTVNSFIQSSKMLLK